MCVCVRASSKEVFSVCMCVCVHQQGGVLCVCARVQQGGVLCVCVCV